MPYLTPNTGEPNSHVTLDFEGGFMAVAAFMGALSELTKPENWQEFGTMTPEQAAEAFQAAYDAVIVENT